MLFCGRNRNDSVLAMAPKEKNDMGTCSGVVVAFAVIGIVVSAVGGLVILLFLAGIIRTERVTITKGPK